MTHSLSLSGFQPDDHDHKALAFEVKVQQRDSEIPFHQHRKGQLIVALHGGITCEVAHAQWLVPPQYAVWIPGGMRHSNRATANARLSFLFIEPGAIAMPDSCCTLRVSPLLRELILALAQRGLIRHDQPDTQRLIQVLFDELICQPIEHFQLPISEHPKIQAMVRYMAENPDSRRTLAHWAQLLAMSERSLARLVVRETGLNYRRWRQQLQLIQAIRMLITGANVQQTARALGYESTTAFITLFRQLMGQTPGQYLHSLENGGEPS
ncbi:AraC family transcriptional regulator [Salmonella enterica subsp. enterica serovar Choleraesuis]|nr:AraC family transcriptional regulator [Salmonella enterica subsp. enterica serovar Choleraesuis]